MSRIVTRGTFLFFSACAILSVGYVLAAMASGDSSGASKALAMSMLMGTVAKISHWEAQ